MRYDHVGLAVALGLAAVMPACGGDDSGLEGNDVPAEKEALFDFLKARGYEGFAAESAAHPSTGPHDSPVRVFLNPALEESLAAGNASHPKGAAAIKELGVKDGEPSGWAVFVKTDADAKGGDEIYWYEILETEDGSDPPYAGKGLGVCKDCHSGGPDFYLSAYPLP